MEETTCEQVIIKIEEDYTSDIIELVSDWKKEIKILANQHKQISRTFYVKHVGYSIPQLIIPVILIFITQINITEEELKYISGLGFLTTGILSSISTFFNFNVKSERHDNASNRYEDLNRYIETNLHRGNNYRIPSDVFVGYIKNEIRNLNQYSPSIENSCLSRCCNP